MNPETSTPNPLPLGCGPLFPIRETFQDECLAFQEKVHPGLEVEEQISLRARASDTLVSTSLFPPVPSARQGSWAFQAGLLGNLDYPTFKALIPGPKAKYYDGLQNRRYHYPGCTMRVYMPATLRGLIPWLRTLGFHQVVLMASDGADWTGHLWRYLPMLDAQWENVLCTGIDAYPHRLLETLRQPTEFLTAVLYAQRWFMPFAGPLRTHPRTLAEKILGRHYDAFPDAVPRPDLESIPQALSGYLAWKEGTVDGVPLSGPGGMAERTLAHVSRIPKLLDAGFLTMLLWKEHLITDPRAVLLERGISRYRGVDVKTIR